MPQLDILLPQDDLLFRSIDLVGHIFEHGGLLDSFGAELLGGRNIVLVVVIVELLARESLVVDV